MYAIPFPCVEKPHGEPQVRESPTVAPLDLPQPLAVIGVAQALMLMSVMLSLKVSD